MFKCLNNSKGKIKMNKLNPKKLSVQFIEGINKTKQIIPRRYILSYSVIKAEFSLTVGLHFIFDKTRFQIDEVLGEWDLVDNKYLFNIYLYVDGEIVKEKFADIHKYIINDKIPFILNAIAYGDRVFLNAHPQLNRAEIIIYFMSENPEFDRIEKGGTFSDYDINFK